MTETVLIAGARTPIGELSGALASLSAADLGAHAIRGALYKAGVETSSVDAVLMGNVVQAGVGPNPARQAAAAAGIPLTVPAITINNLCLSGLQAIIDADRLIKSGDADIVVAGGMESMTNAPYLARGARTGFRYGSASLDDSLDRDALICAFDDVSMGEATDRYVKGTDLTREGQDAFAARSHELAAAATANGTFSAEIVPVEVTSRRSSTTVTDDEGIRAGTTIESLGNLRAAFVKDGTITAGSASQLSDGGAAVVLMSKAKAIELGIEWLAELGTSAFVAGPDTSLLHQPANAITKALEKDGTLKVGDLDVVEINEAFAGVALASTAQLSDLPQLRDGSARRTAQCGPTSPNWRATAVNEKQSWLVALTWALALFATVAAASGVREGAVVTSAIGAYVLACGGCVLAGPATPNSPEGGRRRRA